MRHYPHKVIIYSALHTGTWFSISILTKASTQEADHKADWWIKESFGTIIENLKSISPNSSLSKQWFNKLLNDQEEHNKTFLPHIELVVLQAHQREKNSNLYNSIKKYKPEVPIVVPMRDPFLSLNTRVWRETGTIEGLHAEPQENRTYRVIDQMSSLIRLLEIPKEHIFVFPIDTPRTTEEKIQVFKDLIEHAGLTPNENLIEQATNWFPVNATDKRFLSKQKNLIKIRNDEFIEIKESISNGDMAVAEKFMGLELQLTRKMLTPYISKLKDLGYENLCWW